LLQALKYVPRSIELATAVSLDAEVESGTQRLEIKDVSRVIDGVIVDPEPEPTVQSPPVDVMCSECRQINSHKPDCPHNKQCPSCHAPAGKPHATTCSVKTTNAANPAPQEPEKAADGAQPAAERPKNRFAALFAAAGKKGIPEEDVKRYAYETFDVEGMKDLTDAQVAAVTRWVSELSDGE